MLPTNFMNLNHIIDGSHIQVPRTDGDQPLRNSPNYWELDLALEKYI